MRNIVVAFRKVVIFCHRWLGVALCSVFMLWFTSGVVMMYWGFPRVTDQDRLNRSAALDKSTIRLTPGEAYAKLNIRQPAAQVCLNVFDARPVYRFRTGLGERMVYADTGQEQTEVSTAMIQRIAAAWTGQPMRSAKVQLVMEPDQWTVQVPLRNLRPLWKYSWPDGEQAYISGLTGEVVQFTTNKSRFWAWLGPIPHWLYFTPLRKHQAEWTQVVIWSSGLGTVAAILGLAAGLLMFSPRKRYVHAGVPTSIPYRGQKRWHTILGLVFGLAAATWAFSGLLSMDPFPVKLSESAGGSSRSKNRGPERSLPGILRGQLQLEAFDGKTPASALTEVADLKVAELELISVGGKPFYLATGAPRATRIIPVSGDAISELPQNQIMEIIRQDAGASHITELRVMNSYDAYYLDRHHGKPLPVILARTNDSGNTRYYIDPKTARIVGSYNSSNWISRWLYHGLHSFDFPWLYNYRPLWDIIVISFMLGGSILCWTSMVLAWRVLRGTIFGALPD